MYFYMETNAKHAQEDAKYLKFTTSTGKMILEIIINSQAKT